MKSRKCVKFVMRAISFLILSIMCVGCAGRFTGGGFIDSAAGAPAKATFGFVIDATEPDAGGTPTKVMGQFQYNDHGTGVKFQVDQLTPAGYAHVLGGIFDPQAVLFAYSGTYTCAAGTGTLDLGVASSGQFGPMGEQNNNAVFVDVLTGPYAGYSHAGLVQSGVIQFKPL